MAVRFHEKMSRSFIKGLTFRILVVTSDLIVVFFITHKFDTTFTVVVATNVASFLLYFFHERIWNVIHWGKGKK